MIYYKNATSYTREFYGVTFAPGTVASVPGFINLTGFIKVHELDQKPSVSVDSKLNIPAPKPSKRKHINTGGEQLDG